MKKRVGTIGWWYWAVTAALLALWLIEDNRQAILAAVALTTLQLFHFAFRSGSPVSFPVQVRAGYLGLLLAGFWPPVFFIHWIQLAGTTALVTVDYCPLARLLMLLPWNRRQPFSLGLVRRVLFSRPCEGSIREALVREAEEAEATRAAPQTLTPARWRRAADAGADRWGAR